MVQSFTGTEAISQLFRFEMQLVSERTTVALDSLLGQKVTLRLNRDGGERYFNGYVHQFGKLTSAHGHDHYYVEVVPWLWFLTQTADSRVFQKKTVPEILEAIFGELGFGGDFHARLRGTYKPREYCLQYRETDFNFVTRLMEEEGIFYFFEHSNGSHKLILGDSPSAHQPCPGKSSYRYHGSQAAINEDVVVEFRKEQQVLPGKFTHRDYHYLMPQNNLEASVPSVVKVGGNSKLEIYDYPGYYADRFDELDTGDVLPEGQRLAKVRMEQIEARHVTAHGASTCRTLAAGYKMDMTDHQDGSLNGSYVLTSVYHQGSSNLPDGEGMSYTNVFTCIPSSVPFRPQRSNDKPVVQGPQTAVVVGPKGEEIFTDKYGRVKIQFHWDREGKKDNNSSCWVRVAQSWAGKQWGTHFWPRVGDEVLVVFLEGDPDQPLIVGSVYNAENMPLYTMPDNQTRTGIKTHSTPKGESENFNEIRFEDKKGEEEIYIHAEKDFNRVVENNDSLKVGFEKKDKGNQAIEIFNNQSVVIGDPQAPEGDQKIQILRHRDVTLKQGNDTLTIELGNQETTIGTGKSTTTAMQSIELKVGSNSIKIDQQGITIKGLQVKIEATTTADLTSLMTTVKGNGLLTLDGGMTYIN